jgi:methyl-accepting chemotaxis protein
MMIHKLQLDSIQGRLRGALILPVLIFGACAVWIGFLASASQQQVTAFMDKDLVFQRETKDAYAQGLQSGQAIRNICLDPANPQAYKNLQAAQQGITEALAKAEQTAPSQALKDRLRQVAAKSSDRDALLARIRDLAGQDTKTALQLINQEETPLWRQIKAELIDFAKSGEARVLEVRGQVERSAAQVRMAILASGIITVLLFSLIGWAISRSLRKDFSALLEGIRCVQEGDLRFTFSESASLEIAHVGLALNSMLSQFQGIVKSIHENSCQIASSSQQLMASTSEIAMTSLEVSRSAEVQQTTTERLASATTELSASLDEVGRQIQACEGKAQDTVTATDAGDQAGSDTVQAMDQIRESTRAMTTAVQVIQEIARQTNLLSLNAAIEAAKAGSMGKGFAVVAEEVRKLAERSGSAAKEIGQLIESSQISVDQGTSKVQATSEALCRIRTLTITLREMLGTIALTTEQQARTGNEAAAQVEQSALEAAKNASASTELSATAIEIERAVEHLKKVAVSLVDAADRFKVQ